MKKIGTALCLSALLASSAAQADWEGNWLFGVSAGYGGRAGDVDVTVNNTATGSSVTAGQDLSKNGWLWGLLAGYQVRCNDWLFGGEFALDWLHRNHSEQFAFVETATRSWTSTNKYKQDAIAALTARVGYEVATFFLPYLRAGIETSKDTLNTYGVANTGTVYAAEDNHRSWRFVGGVGAEFPIPDLAGLSLRLEYNYHSKGSAVDANVLASDNVSVVHTSTKQHANTGKASLVYNFL